MTTAKTTEPHDHQTPREEHDTRSDRLELEDEPTEQGVDLDPKRRID